MATLQTLPEELKVLIVSHLDIEPPCVSAILDKPSLSVLRNDDRPLKQLSLVSKQWRRLIRPLLLQHMRLHLDEWVQPGDPCEERESALTRSQDRYIDAVDAAATALISFCNAIKVPRDLQGLTLSTSFVFDPEYMDHLSSYSTNDFWRSMLAVLSPLRVTIVAPYHTLALILDTHSVRADKWAFPDMSIQVCELRRGAGHKSGDMSRTLLASGENSLPFNPLFTLVPWSEVVVSEGSALSAYSIYEFFNQRSPSIYKSLIGYPHALRRCGLRNTLDSIHLRVLFPFNSHVLSFEELSIGWKHVAFTFAPRPGDNVLDDETRVGKADLNDCWNEIEQIYTRAVHPTRSPLWSLRSRIESFTTGDYAIASIRDILDKGFRDWGPNTWKMTRPGKWEITDSCRALRKSHNDFEDEP